MVCSYPIFRGFEHPKVTVVIDCDRYYVQHDLRETLARCTTDLCVVVLENSPTVTDVTLNWKTKQTIKQWEMEIFADASQEENFEFGSTSKGYTNIIVAKFRLDYKKLEEKYAALVNVDKNLEFEKELEVKKIILQR